MKNTFIVTSLLLSSLAISEENHLKKDSLNFVKSIEKSKNQTKNRSKEISSSYLGYLNEAKKTISELSSIAGLFDQKVARADITIKKIDEFIKVLEGESSKAIDIIYLIKQQDSQKKLSEFLSVKYLLSTFVQKNRQYITALLQSKRLISDALASASNYYSSSRNQALLNKIEDLRSYVETNRIISDLTNIKLALLEKKGKYHFSAVEQIEALMVKQCEISKEKINRQKLSLRDEVQLLGEVENICSDIKNLTQNTYQSSQSVHFAIRRIKRRVLALYRESCNQAGDSFNENRCNVYRGILSEKISSEDQHLKEKLTCFERYSNILEENAEIPAISVDFTPEACFSDYHSIYSNSLETYNGISEFYQNSIHDRSVEGLQYSCSEINDRFKRQISLSDEEAKLLVDSLELLDLFIDEKITTEEYLNQSENLENEIFEIQWEMIENYPDYFYSDPIQINSEWKLKSVDFDINSLEGLEFGPNKWQKRWGTPIPRWADSFAINESRQTVSTRFQSTPHDACVEKNPIYSEVLSGGRSIILFEKK